MIHSFKNHIDFLIYYTKAKLEAESFRHHAGYLWWVLDPLIGLGIYYFLFKVVMDRGGPDYLQFLFIGLITWKWFSDCVAKSSGSLLSNLALMKKIRIDKHTFPTVEFFYHTWKFTVIFSLVLVVYCTVLGYGVSVNYLYIPVVLIAQSFLIIGCSYFFASIIPFLPDLQFLVTYMMRLLFYPSGILFSLDHVPEKYKIFVTLNPIAGIINSYRLILMHASAPDFFAVSYGLGIGLVLAITGFMVMRKYDQEYPKLS